MRRYAWKGVLPHVVGNSRGYVYFHNMVHTLAWVFIRMWKYPRKRLFPHAEILNNKCISGGKYTDYCEFPHGEIQADSCNSVFGNHSKCGEYPHAEIHMYMCNSTSGITHNIVNSRKSNWGITLKVVYYRMRKYKRIWLFPPDEEMHMFVCITACGNTSGSDYFRVGKFTGISVLPHAEIHWFCTIFIPGYSDCILDGKKSQVIENGSFTTTSGRTYIKNVSSRLNLNHQIVAVGALKLF